MLPYPDRHYLDAAQGWLILGNLREASIELQRISLSGRSHPDCLQAHTRILIAGKNWFQALLAAERQQRMHPELPEGWLNRAYCLHELNRTGEALDTLLLAARRFPRHKLISFNVSCYLCHLEQFHYALQWANRTSKLFETEKVNI